MMAWGVPPLLFEDQISCFHAFTASYPSKYERPNDLAADISKIAAYERHLSRADGASVRARLIFRCSEMIVRQEVEIKCKLAKEKMSGHEATPR